MSPISKFWGIFWCISSVKFFEDSSHSVEGQILKWKIDMKFPDKMLLEVYFRNQYKTLDKDQKLYS